jgi:methylmalonyl-CoA/ethylmalonyl-CoA epimerase
MITHLDHVAIVVEDLPEGVRRFVEELGVRCEGTEAVPEAQTDTAFLAGSLDGSTKVELVAPLEGRGPLKKYLGKRGPGLHHLCFATDDVAGDMARLKAKGYRFTTEQPTPGAHGTLVAWLHPKSTGGVLIELAQHPDPKDG